MSTKDLEVPMHFSTIREAAVALSEAELPILMAAVATITINRDGSVDVVGVPTEFFDQPYSEDKVCEYLIGAEVGEGLAAMIGLEL